MRRSIIVALPLVAVALLLPASGATRTAKDGGTFRVGADAPYLGTIDPAAGLLSLIQFLRAACGTLMAYPDKRLPAGLVLGPELAEAGPVVTGNGRTYTFTIRRNARFSTGAP